MSFQIMESHEETHSYFEVITYLSASAQNSFLLNLLVFHIFAAKFLTKYCH